MIVCASLYEASYRPMSDLTLGANRLEFCERWGHKPFFVCVEKPADRPIKEIHRHLGFEKLRVVLGALEETPQASWVWFMDADAMVTDMSFDLEKYLNAIRVEVAISRDSNGPNPGPLAVKNTPWAKTFIKNAIALEADSAFPYEGEALLHIGEITSCGNNGPRFMITPQRPLNLYDYSLYPGSGPKDDVGVDGQWHEGDFIIHWPGRTLEQRVAHYHEYAGKVKR